MPPEVIGWCGNGLLLTSAYLIGNKNRSAFLWTVAGELVWVGYSAYLGFPSMVFICAVFAVMAARNWWKWGQA